MASYSLSSLREFSLSYRNDYLAQINTKRKTMHLLVISQFIFHFVSFFSSILLCDVSELDYFFSNYDYFFF